ncbi:MAG: class I SAM-dependent methyltransferase [Planctomycetes bacterium]|nr:class I SAM-dependent methyltransferase [Planctomycetota bacterium]
MATDVPCDICGCINAVEIPAARIYTGGHPIHVCTGCGLVHCRDRRSSEEIAALWSREIYGAPDGDEKGRGELSAGAMQRYSALTPFVRARHVFVAEMIDQLIGLNGKRVVDVGAGQGEFLRLLRTEYGAQVFGVEPSEVNCGRMQQLGIDNFCGTAEAFAASAASLYEVATIVWTLENCQSCAAVIDATYRSLDDGGHIVVATGSRILVPFKKPLQYFFSNTLPQDTHPFYFSNNTLTGALARAGFEVVHRNRFIDSDYLVLIARKTDRSRPIAWERDDPGAVLDFFDRWHRETQAYYRSM